MAHEFNHAEEAEKHLTRSMDIQGPAKEQAYARGQLHAQLATVAELQKLNRQLAEVKTKNGPMTMLKVLDVG